MENKDKNLLSEEHLRKIKYRTGYKISESPRYRPLVNDNEEFDSVPDSNYATLDGQPVPQSPSFSSIYEVGEQEDSELAQQKDPREPSNAPTPEIDVPVPAFDAETGKEPLIGGPQAADDPLMGAPKEPEAQVDEIQNDIIKHNIEAMKSIHDQLESLNTVVQGLNSKLGELNAEVEEVREPTNTEKLMSKTNVSYPYYFNLNDFWDGNWFNQKRDEQMEKGVRELPDGTFVADFDELPQKSKIDVQNSFNDII